MQHVRNVLANRTQRMVALAVIAAVLLVVAYFVFDLYAVIIGLATVLVLGCAVHMALKYRHKNNLLRREIEPAIDDDDDEPLEADGVEPKEGVRHYDPIGIDPSRQSPALTALLRRIRVDLSAWQPTQGNKSVELAYDAADLAWLKEHPEALPKGYVTQDDAKPEPALKMYNGRVPGQFRATTMAGAGGYGKSTIAGLIAAILGHVLLLDANVVGRLAIRYPTAQAHHDYTAYDLAMACLAGMVKTLSDFGRYTVRTDSGAYLARRPTIHQPDLQEHHLLAILECCGPIFPDVICDGGNTMNGVMEAAIEQSDTVVVVDNTATESHHVGLTDVANLMQLYPGKPVMVVLNWLAQPGKEADAMVMRALRQYLRPTDQPIRRTFRKFRDKYPDGMLTIRTAPFEQAFHDDRPLLMANLQGNTLQAAREITATAIELGTGQPTGHMPPGKYEDLVKKAITQSVIKAQRAAAQTGPQSAGTKRQRTRADEANTMSAVRDHNDAAQDDEIDDDLGLDALQQRLIGSDQNTDAPNGRKSHDAALDPQDQILSDKPANWDDDDTPPVTTTAPSTPQAPVPSAPQLSYGVGTPALPGFSLPFAPAFAGSTVPDRVIDPAGEAKTSSPKASTKESSKDEAAVIPANSAPDPAPYQDPEANVPHSTPEKPTGAAPASAGKLPPRRRLGRRTEPIPVIRGKTLREIANTLLNDVGEIQSTTAINKQMGVLLRQYPEFASDGDNQHYEWTDDDPPVLVRVETESASTMN